MGHLVTHDGGQSALVLGHRKDPFVYGDAAAGKYKVVSKEGKAYTTDNVFPTREAKAEDLKAGIYVFCIDTVKAIGPEDQSSATWKVRRVKGVAGEEVEVEFWDSYWTRWTSVKCHLQNVRIPLEPISAERVKKVRP